MSRFPAAAARSYESWVSRFPLQHYRSLPSGAIASIRCSCWFGCESGRPSPPYESWVSKSRPGCPSLGQATMQRRHAAYTQTPCRFWMSRFPAAAARSYESWVSRFPAPVSVGVPVSPTNLGRPDFWFLRATNLGCPDFCAGCPSFPPMFPAAAARSYESWVSRFPLRIWVSKSRAPEESWVSKSLTNLGCPDSLPIAAKAT
jgi:hypothetical protein